MVITIRDIVKDAMSIIGILQIGDEPTAAQAQTFLRRANIMLDNWSARRLMVRSTVLSNFSLVANTASYLIGTGKTFNTSKPLAILSAYVRDSNGNDVVLQPFNSEEVYGSMTNKSTVTGQPEYFLYDPLDAQQATSNYGQITVYPTPDKAYTLFIEQQKYLTEFTTLNEVVTFEPAYYEALLYNLAIRIWGDFYEIDRMIPDSIATIAVESYKTIETLNSRQPLARVDTPGVNSSFNIYSGD